MRTLAVGVCAPELIKLVGEDAHQVLQQERRLNNTMKSDVDFMPLTVFTHTQGNQAEKLFEKLDKAVAEAGIEPFSVYASGYSTRGCGLAFCHPTVVIEFGGRNNLAAVQKELRSFHEPATELLLPLHMHLVHTRSKQVSDNILARLAETRLPDPWIPIVALSVFEEHDGRWREIYCTRLRRKAA